jgi:Na+/H+ antiporter NhaD/arsenite permease-like protein
VLNIVGNQDRFSLAPDMTTAVLVVFLLVYPGVILGALPFLQLDRTGIALLGAGVLLMSRKLHSTRMPELVDWELLVLFMGLFVVNRALQATGLPTDLVAQSAATGVMLDDPVIVSVVAFVLSNIVSNVPAVILLLPVATHEMAGPLLALVSTLAGNLLIIGSIANIIVVDAAARCGIRIAWRTHARIGIPVTFATLAITALWFALKTA